MKKQLTEIKKEETKAIAEPTGNDIMLTEMKSEKTESRLKGTGACRMPAALRVLLTAMFHIYIAA